MKYFSTHCRLFAQSWLITSVWDPHAGCRCHSSAQAPCLPSDWLRLGLDVKSVPGDERHEEPGTSPAVCLLWRIRAINPIVLSQQRETVMSKQLEKGLVCTPAQSLY